MNHPSRSETAATIRRTMQLSSPTPTRARSVPLVAALVLLVLAGPALHAQGSGDDVFLNPQYALPMFVGGDVGYTFWNNSASFVVSDQAIPCATFSNGDGKGPDYGAKAFLYLNPWLLISPRVRVESRPGSFVTSLPGEPARDASNNEVTLAEEAQADVEMSSITLDVRVGVDIAETGLYIAAGGAGNLMTAGTYDYTERITGPQGFVYTSSYDTEQRLRQAYPFDTYQQFSFEARGGVGYLLELGRFVLNPEVYYSYPLTSLLGAPDSMKQTGLAASVGFLFNIGQ